MTREITLELMNFEDKLSLHAYLKEALDFPFYYGANLDALHDELSCEMVNTRITVRYPAKPRGQMEVYLPRLLRVFRDTAEENYHLEFIYEEIA